MSCSCLLVTSLPSSQMPYAKGHMYMPSLHMSWQPRPSSGNNTGVGKGTVERTEDVQTRKHNNKTYINKTSLNIHTIFIPVLV